MVKRWYIALSHKTKFILKYTFRALISLIIIFAAILLFKVSFFDHNPEYWIDTFYSNPTVIYLIYIGSEVFFGLFPPEIFIVWALNKGDTLHYVLNVVFFTSVSMAAGHLAYFVGRIINKLFSRRYTTWPIISKYLPFVRRYGALLIVIAALTPLPWSTISLVMGTINFRYRLFTLYALSRILRFAIVGYLIFYSKPLLF